MTPEARRVLTRIATHAGAQVAIVSGRNLRDLRRLVGVKGLRYFGVQGAEREQKPVALSQKSRLALASARLAARLQIETIPGVWVEDKGLSFAVHYRGADAAAAESAGVALAGLLAKWRSLLHILNGSRVWEVLPREIPGKSMVVEDVLRAFRVETAVVYIGDDGTDENAFVVLPNQITVRVGRDPYSGARYSVRTPTEVLRLLARMEKELP